MKAMLRLLATSFGLGYLPLAPGTWGSLAGVALYWWAMDYGLGWPMLLCITLILPLIGWFACREGESAWGHDPGRVVIDEVAGQWLTLLIGGSASWPYLIGGFVLFRIFDIWKPGPVDKLQRLPGAWGVMADDLLAGVFGGLILLAVRLFC